MKKTSVCIVLTILFGGALVADVNRAGMDSLSTQSNKTSRKHEVLLERVDAVIEMIENDDAVLSRGFSIGRLIEARTQAHLVTQSKGTKTTFTPEERKQVVMTFLSEERYDELEKTLTELLESEDKELRVLSMHLLSRSLASSAGKSKMSAMVKSGMRKLIQEEELVISSKELFTAAEGLAYLGSSDGVEVLKSALRSKDGPSFLKRRSLEALSYLGFPVTTDFMAKMLFSKNASVAYTAFDLAEKMTDNQLVIDAAIEQIDYLKNIYEGDEKLTYNQSMLLHQISLMVKFAFRENALSEEEIMTVKNKIYPFVRADDVDIKKRVVSLFSDLANDRDSELIGTLLRHKSARMRSIGALALTKCSENTIRAEKDVLMKLLDDESSSVRNNALFALGLGVGVKTGNVLSEARFDLLKKKVLDKYNDL